MCVCFMKMFPVISNERGEPESPYWHFSSIFLRLGFSKKRQVKSEKKTPPNPNPHSEESQKSSVPYAAPGVHWWSDSWLDQQPIGVF